MLQTFSTKIKGAIGRCLALSYAVGVDGLIYLRSFRSYFILDGLWPYYCNKYSFEDLDVIKCVIELSYNSSSTVFVSITDPGMTLKHRDFNPFWVGSLQDGIRAHADCRTRPLGNGKP